MGILRTFLTFSAGYALGAKMGTEPMRRTRGKLVARLPAPIRSIAGGITTRELREVMTPAPQTVPLDTPISAAARLMAAEAIGDVIVTEPGTERVAGIVTDRDIAIRAVADGRDLDATTVEEIFSRDLVALAPTDTVERALDLMRGLNVRRLPVVEGDRAVGFVSLGDLSIGTDVGAALAEISSAAPDR